MKRPTHIEAAQSRSLRSQITDLSVPFHHTKVSRPEPKPSVPIWERASKLINAIRVNYEWQQVEKKIRNVLRRLSNSELAELPNMFYWDDVKETWLVKPNLDKRLRQKLKNYFNESTGEVHADVQLAMTDVYLAEMERRGLL